MQYDSIKGCIVVTCQSNRSKKFQIEDEKVEPTLPRTRITIFFQPAALTGHNFIAPWSMMMNSSSFKIPMLYLCALNLESTFKVHNHSSFKHTLFRGHVRNFDLRVPSLNRGSTLKLILLNRYQNFAGAWHPL